MSIESKATYPGIGSITTVHEDTTFRKHCRDGTYTFQNVMEFLRRKNSLDFRENVISGRVPEHLKEQVTIQCKLEGLL